MGGAGNRQRKDGPFAGGVTAPPPIRREKMCLSTVDKEIKVAKGKGWKCYLERGGNLSGLCGFDTGPITEGAWMTDPQTEDIARLPYETGYHLYRSKRAAERAGWIYDCIRQVSFRNVTATGTDSGFRAVVAREIYIHPRNVI
ncbi:hypothetical protein LCGC14_2501860 [marine sediment metagenome]|uniref:Uncharacterized protein n=1 Tax=marine sediment metagenome TaxID=412755 RepID=A0A0F9B1M6_9ZZZZ